ncbi:hypothetical protein RhiXN_11249 [Rhizoctonia solani]|uniref:Uncharacterized protein n=1 Tax=Rhizoctonia solani TaxID=456999 RepID=A0A8H8T2T9_9AGAM|nr:uncharacterized protein RhiXN_11249 [Rhizoctonia solani]QRW26172.1 hypothetical protein RhiXN_11249 [Rhizoctonia solani]
MSPHEVAKGDEVQEQPDVQSNKEVHLRQLFYLLGQASDLSDSSEASAIGKLIFEPNFELFYEVYVTCLMHSLYRPVDPSRTILFMVEDPDDELYWKRVFAFHQPPPTHILGLMDITYDLEGTGKEEKLALLVWGTCKLVDGHTFDMELTYSGNRAQASSSVLSLYTDNYVEELVKKNLPTDCQIRQLALRDTKWPEDLHLLSEIELDMLFCQLISSVVYDMPFDSQSLEAGLPVAPQWEYQRVQSQIQALLGQRINGSLSFKAIYEKEEVVPERIYLHGDPFLFECPPTNNQFEDYWEDLRDKEDNIPAVPIEEIGRWTEIWVEQRAALEVIGQQQYYLRYPDQLRYQSTTPSVAPEYIFNEPAAQPGNSQSGVTQRDLVARSHNLMLGYRRYGHTARLAYWKQLRESIVDVDCLSLITTHLWLSSLMAAPDRSILYLDPKLVAIILDLDRRGPAGVNGNISELFERQVLWEQMGPLSTVLALLNMDELCEPSPGKLSWMLLELRVEHGQVTMVEVILAPCMHYDKAQFTQLMIQLIEALNQILPTRPLVSQTSKVQQKTHSLILPPPFSEESIVLVMMAYLCGKLLDQQVATVEVQAMRQGLCFYFDSALRNLEVDYSFPWPGLTNNLGALLTECNEADVARRRFHLASNQEPSPIEMFPLRRSYTATVATPGPSEPFFLELAQSCSSHKQGLLVHTSGQSIEALDKAILLGQYPSFDPLFNTLLDGANSLSLDELTNLVYSLGGPENAATHRLLMTGEHNNMLLSLDWEKDAIHPEPEWLLSGYDMDSLSLTCFDVPEILEAGSYHPYPNRDLSLMHSNELTVDLQGKDIKMHTCKYKPTFYILSTNLTVLV